jgi:membrane associated rhomboid family serine protease
MAIATRLRRAISWPIYLLILIWIIFIFDYYTGGDWFIYGIAPRKTFALRGIFTAPFLHGSWAHLLSNTPPFFVLMAMILYFYPRVAVPVLLLIYLGTGLMMWLFADPEAFLSLGRVNYHIGASGVVYGMAAFLATNGIVRRNVRAIAIALVIVFYYGGLIWGVLPIKEGVSWEGHLLGAVVGIFAAYWFRHRIEEAEQRNVPDYELNPEEEQYFLDRDTFDKRKWE